MEGRIGIEVGAGGGGGGGGGGGSGAVVNLSKLIRLDEVEVLLQGMQDRLDAQERTIISLQRLCTGLLTKQSANEVFDDLQQSVSRLSSRIDQVQVSATSRVGPEREMPAGELAYLNSLHIQQLTSTLAECARRVEVAEQFAAVVEQTQADLRQVRETTAPLDFAKRLQQAHQDASLRLAGVETLVACKVDRSEMGNLQALLTSLDAYASFREETNETLQEIKESSNQLEVRVSTNSAHLITADRDREEMTTEMKTLAPKTETRALSQALESLSATVQLCATKASLRETDARVEQGAVLQEQADAATLDLSARLAEAFASLSTKATQTAVRACVLRSHYDEAVTALGSDIDTKAANVDLEAVDKRVVTLESKLEGESARLAVAMRFVDWFTSRGENYEHNLKLVDKHLKNLAMASNPHERTPFTGQVRFTNVMQQQQQLDRSAAAAAAGAAEGAPRGVGGAGGGVWAGVLHTRP